MGTIIVALLAITMAILPITMPQAAVSAEDHHALATGAGHEHAATDGDHEHADTLASSGGAVSTGSNDHGGDSEDCTGVLCCSMSTCHAFQVSAHPSLYSPAVSQASMTMPGDEQIAGITVGGLDRPPRTV
jgi:hypothetical protein